MRTLLFMASLALSAQLVYAQEQSDALTQEREQVTAGDVLNFIGGIAAEQFDRHPGPGPGFPGGPGGPGGGPGFPNNPGPGPGPGYPGGPNDWDYDVICYARDARGNVYRAAGPVPRQVQERAMVRCQRYARFCRAEGCQRL